MQNNSENVKVSVRLTLYTSSLIALLHAFQYGWSTSQMNYTAYHDPEDCRADPVPYGRCVLFPGHSKLEWTFMVNAWIVGGMIGSLGSKYPADTFGRKKTILFGACIMILGAALQAFAGSVVVFVIGRLVAGISSGGGTAVLGSYLSEIAPPHLRGAVVSSIQVAIVSGIFLVSVTFYVADNELGARVNAGLPMLLGVITLLFAPLYMVESPTWLIEQGYVEHAHQTLARLFGPENIDNALNWIMQTDERELEFEILTPDENDDVLDTSKSNTAVLNAAHYFAKDQENMPQKLSFYKMQLLVAVGCSAAQQLSGINAIFYYSSDIFKAAGVSDVRVGNLIVNSVNAIPTFCIGYLLLFFKKRTLMLGGLLSMCICAVGMTIALISGISALSILFTALYVAAFASSLGPLVWGITAELFPDAVRASSQAICLVVNWFCNLLVGVAYPYIADALGDYGFVPFVCILAIFFVFVWYMLPETLGKTMEEIQAEFRTKRETEMSAVTL